MSDRKFQILSNQENIKGSTNKFSGAEFIKKAKEELLGSLIKTNNITNRNNLSYEISEKIGDEGYPKGYVIFGGKRVKVDSKKFQSFKNLYFQINKEENKSIKNKKLYELNCDFAEKLILESGSMIEFGPKDKFEENRTPESEAKKTFEKLNKLDEYKDKIERAKKIFGDETHFVVKRTKDQLKIFEAMERVSKEEGINISDDEKLEEKIKEDNKNVQEMDTFDSNNKGVKNHKENKDQEISSLKEQLKEAEENNKKLNEKAQQLKQRLKENKGLNKENLIESTEKVNLGKLINRDNLSDAIYKIRVNSKYPVGSIEIRSGIFLDISKEPYYNEYKEKYIEAKNNDARLKDLDTELAEHIILGNPKMVSKDQQYYIQINNDNNEKSQEELVQESLRCRDSLINQGYNVEYIVYEENSEINLKEKERKEMELQEMFEEEKTQLKKIAELESELDSKRLHVDEKDRVAKQEELERLQDKLSLLQKDISMLEKEIEELIKPGKKHHIIRQKKQRELPPHEEMDYEKTLDDELDINFSDMKQTIKDVANERTYNEDSREYVEGLKNKNTKFGRMLLASKQAMFGDLFRLRKFKKHRKNIDSTKTKLNIRGDRANIAKVHSGQGVKSVMELTETEYPTVYNAIDDLAYRFYKGGSTMSSGQFETELRQIFDSARDLRDDLESEGVDINKSASDILMSLETQKAQNELTYQISQAVDAALPTVSSTLNTSQADALATNISNQCKQFTKNHKLIPQLFQHYNKIKPKGDQLNLSNSYEDISKYLVAHLDSLSMVMNQSMTNKIKLNIKFLAKGHSTDYIEAKKGEKQKRWNPLSRLGNNMYANGYKWRRLPTKVLATGGTAVIGTILLGPVGGIVAGSLVAGSLASGKKAAQLQRKKHSIEREYVKDRKNQTDITNEEDLLRLQYLKDIGNYEDIKKEMDKILSQSSLSQKDKDDLFGLLSRIIAGLDHQKDTGHNAFSIDKTVKESRPEQIEIQKDANYNEAMKELHKLKELSFKRLQLDNVNLDEDDIRSDVQYQSYSSGYKGDFKKFLKLFKKDRRKETRKTGARTAAIYGAVGGITAGIAHFIDTAGSEEVAIAAAERTGDMTTGIEDLGTADVLYELGKFDSGSELSNEVGDQLSSLPADATKIQVDYFAGVDGTPANVTSFTTDMVEDKIYDIESLLDSGSFSQETIDNVKQVVSDKNIEELIRFAEEKGADVGNRNLFTLRNLEGVEELLKQVDAKNLDVEFNFDQLDSIIGDTSYIPDDRLSGLDIKAIVEKVSPKNPEPPIGSTGANEWRAGQGVYTEDNKHKGQESV